MAIEGNLQRQGGQVHEENNVVDEIKQYLDFWYISAPESSWRIFDFKIQGRHPFVERMHFHLNDKQVVVFRNDSHLHSVVNNPKLER